MIKQMINFIVSKKNRPLVIATFTLFATGTIVFHFLEGWRWFDSFYFCVVTLATVGYGDLAPKTDLGKIFTIFYIISGIGIFLAFIQGYFDFLKEGRKNK